MAALPLIAALLVFSGPIAAMNTTLACPAVAAYGAGPNTFPTTSVATLTGGSSGGAVASTPIGAAQFDNPLAIVLDALDGALYVSDYGNRVVRRIDAGTGLVTIAAGQNGESGDTEHATDPTLGEFKKPAGLAIYYAAPKRLFVADEDSHRIRQMWPGLTRLAGGSSGAGDGTGAAAEFDKPRGLALKENTGQLFVADAGGRTIRVVDIATQAVTTLSVAGMSDKVEGLAYDPYGDLLWMADGGFDSGDGSIVRMAARFTSPTTTTTAFA